VLGNAVTVAFFTALTVCFYAFVRGAVGLPPSAPNQAVLSLLLAIPAFLAAALGRGISSDKLPATSLTTFYGLWIVVIVSVAAVGLFLSDVNQFESLRYNITIFTFERQVNLLWVILALVGVIAFIVLRKEKSDQRRYYLKMLSAIDKNSNSN
jgi:hypothetical protein